MSMRNRWLLVLIVWGVVTFLGVWFIPTRHGPLIWYAVMLCFGAWPIWKMLHAPGRRRPS